MSRFGIVVPHLALVGSLFLLVGCEGGVNLFSIEDDKQLGADLAAQIEADPENYPLLDEGQFPEAYAHLDRMRDELLVSDDFVYAEEFDWELHIVDDASTLNAFAAPGGYIYIYTGLMEYLTEEDELVGVLGHEMAHADRRHSTEQLTEIYGISTLASLVLGKNPGLLAEIAAGLVSLQFSRSDEAEADSASVEYLCDTDYASNATAGFFEQLLEEGGSGVPEFLSSHPSSENRVADINAYADDLGCSTDPSGNDYSLVLDSLP
ncbi:MAG: M48 family metalloprotease [Deltaproteobacteria bacterium]|nr:M48 family metalloprotease [Deltaproteobacteria bacterium]